MPKHYQKFLNEDEEDEERVFGIANISRSSCVVTSLNSSRYADVGNDVAWCSGTSKTWQNDNNNKIPQNGSPVIRSLTTPSISSGGGGNKTDKNDATFIDDDDDDDDDDDANAGLGAIAVDRGAADNAPAVDASPSAVIATENNIDVVDDDDTITVSRPSKVNARNKSLRIDMDGSVSSSGSGSGSRNDENIDNGVDDDRGDNHEHVTHGSFYDHKTSSSILSTTMQSSSSEESNVSSASSSFDQNDNMKAESNTKKTAAAAAAVVSGAPPSSDATTTTSSTSWFGAKYNRLAVYGCLFVTVILLFMAGLLVGMYTSNVIGNNSKGTGSTPTASNTLRPIGQGYGEDGDGDDQLDVDKKVDEDDNSIIVGSSFPSESPTSFPSATSGPSAVPSSSPTFIAADVDISTIPSSPTSPASRANFTVGVFYYPSHDETNSSIIVDNQVSISRNANNNQLLGRYIRKDLVPRQYPMLGEYDNSDSEIIAAHIRMLQRANVNLLVTNWSGPSHASDITTKNLILSNADVSSNNMKIALHYDTFNRLHGLEDENNTTDSDYNHRSYESTIDLNMEIAKTDTMHMCEEYFGHPNYYRINGRPVVVVDVSRQIHSLKNFEDSLLSMRTQATNCGHFIYLVGNGVVNDVLDHESLPFWYFDAVTNNIIQTSSVRATSSGGYAGKERVVDYYNYQSERKDEMFLDDCRFIPTVSPGFNDRSIHPDKSNPILSRRLTKDGEEGSLFYYQLQQAKKLVDPEVNNMILINSFNDWRTDTQIEPLASSPTSSWPPTKTDGLEYDGYGYLYLDILGASTLSAQHSGIFDYLYEV